MTMITPSYLGETIEYSSLHACRSTLEDPTFEEAIPDIASAVQEIKQRQLTEQWLEQLKKKFPVRYEMATINKLFRR